MIAMSSIPFVNRIGMIWSISIIVGDEKCWKYRSTGTGNNRTRPNIGS